MLRNKVKFFVFLLLLLSSKQAFAVDMKCEVLKNKMTVCAVNQPFSSVVMHSIWYKVGSIDEPYEHSGIAHIVEHMMFKGSKNLTEKEFLHNMQRAGAQYNATTNTSYTNYYSIVRPEYLPLMMYIESDRMRKLTFKDEQFQLERSVVKQERLARVDSSVFGGFAEELNYILYRGPKSLPIIGQEDTINNITSEDVKEFHDHWYIPSNAYVVITGNIDPDKAISLAKKFYGPIKDRTILFQESSFIGKSRHVFKSHNTVQLKDPRVKQKVLAVAMPVDTLYTVDSKNIEDVLTVELIADLMDAVYGDLYKYSVIQDKVFSHLEVSFDPLSRGGSAVVIYALFNDNIKASYAENYMSIVLNKIANKGLNSKSIRTMKRKIHNDMSYMAGDVEAYNFYIAQHMMAGTDKEIFLYKSDNIMSITNSKINKTFKSLVNGPLIYATLTK